jgi:hypothetical protein
VRRTKEQIEADNGAKVIAAAMEFRAMIDAEKAEVVAPVVTDATEAAQSYALRIWNGQSRDLDRADRIARCKAGVEGQGMSFDGVELP